MIYNPPKASNPASPSGSVQINSSGVFGALSGTGFLKLTGTTPSFDNTTYYPNSILHPKLLNRTPEPKL